MKWGLIFFIAALIAGCKPDARQIEEYGDISTGPGGNDLSTIEEHRGGWQRNECLMCHNVNLNVHRNANPPINVADLNVLIRMNQGSKYCLTCHHDNGL
jgi:hypothetical protein